MIRITERKNGVMSVLFTMLLFLVFVLCALFTVLIGSRVYENITARSEWSYTGNTALSYIANKVRQGDRSGLVDVVDVDNTPVLELRQDIDGTEYVTWIYWKDGSIRELFTDAGSGLGLEDGLEIMACSGLELSKKGRRLHIQTLGKGGDGLSLFLRSGGLWEDD